MKLTPEDREKWHSGPPPHVGWWNASVECSPKSWRWWNGVCWSISARVYYSEYQAGYAATKAIQYIGRIYWRHYYPADARVPRINPCATNTAD